MPRVVVQIVTHNNAATLGDCIDSVRAQEAECGLLIVDNASTDGTQAVALQRGAPILCLEQNLGYSAAHNLALTQTASEYVLTLNPDARLMPGFVQALMDALDADETIGSAAGCVLRVESLAGPPQGIDSAGLYMRRSRRQGLRAENHTPQDCPDLPQPIFGPDGSAAFYRRAMLEDIRVLGEIFDEDFFLQKEDVDICWRAQLRGWRSIYVPGALAWHIRTFRPGRRRGVNPLLRYYGVRNRYLLMLKNDVTPVLRRDWWRIGLYDLAVFAYVLLLERSSLASFSAAWRLRRRMLEKRRAIQAGRRVDAAAMAVWFQSPPLNG